jgi:hypothetical protein
VSALAGDFRQIRGLGAELAAIFAVFVGRALASRVRAFVWRFNAHVFLQ